MAKVYIEPDPILHQKAKPIAVFDAALSKLIIDMRRTLKEAKGIGLAAPQIGQSIRLAIVDIPENDARTRKASGLYVLINPRITMSSRTRTVMTEGCLSIPGIEVDVERPESITVTYQDQIGKTQVKTANGILARAIQHEIDHLNGILITDYGAAKPIKNHENF